MRSILWCLLLSFFLVALGCVDEQDDDIVIDDDDDADDDSGDDDSGDDDSGDDDTGDDDTGDDDSGDDDTGDDDTGDDDTGDDDSGDDDTGDDDSGDDDTTPVDADGDGYDETVDCDDNDPLTYPGAEELCDGLDNDCDGIVPADEVDADGDSFLACDDCDDSDPDSYPGATELCDGLDNDCDGVIPADETDGDGDGHLACDDCDDTDPDSYPGATELCDGLDNDCDGAIPADEQDADADGFAVCQGDCDDSLDTVYPGAPEICDTLDNDCDGQIDEGLNDDLDGDTFTLCDGDCDDNDDTVYPGAPELCDGLDNDCDGVIPADEVDADGDGQLICGGDCDDADPTTYDGAPELCDGIDNDCDGTVDEDVDSDLDGDGFTPCLGDCDDGDDTVYPGAPELCDGLDNDCDGAIPADEVDADGDGYLACEECDDTDDTAYPGAPELCDGIDNDCDGVIPADESDGDADGYLACEECDDNDDTTYPGAPEPCDGIDHNCDGVVLPGPTLSSVTPDLTCVAGVDAVLVLTGLEFITIGTLLPTVDIGGAYAAVADTASGCMPVTGAPGYETCTELTFIIPAGAIPAGIYAVTVIDPPPLTCSSTDLVEIEVVPDPWVDAITPASTCHDDPAATFVVDGAGLLLLGADCTDPLDCPMVTIDGVDLVPDALASCNPLAGPAGGESCTELTFTIPPGAMSGSGSFAVEITNPAPADCSSNLDVLLDVLERPIIDSVDPDTICAEGGDFTIYGSGFQQGAEVWVGAVQATVVTWVSDTQLDISVPSGLAPGLQDVLVINPDGCQDMLPAAIDVVTGPALFFVDPPVIYSEMTTQVSLYIGGVHGSVTEIWLEEDATGTLHEIVDFLWDGDNTVYATIPAFDLSLPEGDYWVHVYDETGCTPFQTGTLYVEEDLTIAVTGVEPSFGWEQADTPVDIVAAELADLLPGEVQFIDLPRVYLNPSSGDVATALRSVAFQDETLLTAVVPDGLLVDTYDVIVVNPPPGNEIGVLFGGVTITVDPPPVIYSISPTRCSASSPTPVTINGADFRNPTVELTCQDPNQTITQLTTTVASFTGDTIDTTVPSNLFGEGTVCVVRVWNDDGSYFDYSALSIGSPSGNLFAWNPGTSMGTPRRAPATVTGRVTERARYLYAMGGDDGTAAGALNSIEASPIDVFGGMGAWRDLPSVLPAPRTLAGAALVGRYLFVAGGHDGSVPVDTVLRAQILDPLAAPEFDDLGIYFGNGFGLEGGFWSYRISAVFDAADPINPGGESLASDSIAIWLPDVPDLIHLDLYWTKVDSAIGYNVYRTPTAGSGSGTEELLDYVPDDGDPTNLVLGITDQGDPTTPGQHPLPYGSLGNWATAALLPGADALDAARQSPCTAQGRDPLDPAVTYLYLGGGMDGNGLIRDTILVVPIADGGETVGAPFSSGSVLAEPRHDCGGFTLDNTYNSVVAAGETWIYFGPGNDGTGWTTESEAGQVAAGGDLTWTGGVGGLTPARGAYANFCANNFVYVVGGERNGNPAMQGGSESEISAPPDLDGFNSLGGNVLDTPRAFPGSAIESAVVFTIGGVDDLGAALDTTEYTNF